MTAPGCVELNQDILLVVHDDLLVVLGDNDGNRAVLLLRNGLRLDAGLNLAGNEVVDESADGCSGDLSASEGELLVLGGVLNSESGPLADLKVQVAGVLAESLGVDGSDVELAFDLLGNRLEEVSEGLALLWGLSKDVCEGDASLEFAISGRVTLDSQIL